TNFDMNCKVKLSNDFKSDKYHINLNTGIQSTEEKDMETFQTKIDQDRIMIIRVHNNCTNNEITSDNASKCINSNGY
ncbi:unnamed protein product, partial [Rotaria socialis]